MGGDPLYGTKSGEDKNGVEGRSLSLAEWGCPLWIGRGFPAEPAAFEVCGQTPKKACQQKGVALPFARLSDFPMFGISHK